MTPERMAALVAWWVRFYTRDLPPGIAQRRVDEVDADLHDQVAYERAEGTGDRRIALSVMGRMLRGLAADASWRLHTIARSPTRKDKMTPNRPVSRSVARVALATALILLVPLVLMQVSDGANWSVGDFVFAGVLLAGTGALLELAARKGHNLVYRAAAVAVGLAAIAFGEADDAPGLVGFGFLLILGTVALTVRTAWRSE